MLSSYASMQEFYEVRIGTDSPERDFGWFHYDDQEIRVPGHPPRSWRVTVVFQTGDVYACWGRKGEVRLPGILTTDPNDSPITAVTNLPEPPLVYRMAEECFQGWQEAPGVGKTLSWFVVRIHHLLYVFNRWI